MRSELLKEIEEKCKKTYAFNERNKGEKRTLI